MATPPYPVSVFTPHAPGARLVRAQRLAALLTLSLMVLGSYPPSAGAHPGDAIARSVKERAAKARRQSGWASYYGREFNHRKTASGERFDPNQLTAAHRTLPFGTLVKVTNLDNGRHVVVRINDRGPFKKGRVLDLSPAAARAGLRRWPAHVGSTCCRLPKAYTAVMTGPDDER
jgi:rare lipoprotein A